MDGVSPLTLGATDAQRSVGDVMEHLAGLLDVTCQDFEGVQRIVGESTPITALPEADVQALQKLDSATQTVEAVARVLRNMASCYGQQGGCCLNVSQLSEGVKLSHVVQVLRDGEPAQTAIHAGEMDLF